MLFIILTCRLRHVQEEGENGEGVAITPRQAREAHIKLKALNQATVKMASHIESLEEENRTLKDNSQEVHTHVLVDVEGYLCICTYICTSSVLPYSCCLVALCVAILLLLLLLFSYTLCCHTLVV